VPHLKWYVPGVIRGFPRDLEQSAGF
jgi:hypothetical protein